MTTRAGQWIEADPAQAVAEVMKTQPEPDSGLTPSPFDMPLALRVIEGDVHDPAYSVELRYISGDEARTRTEAGRLDVEVGAKSGRVYRVTVGTQLAVAGGRTDVRLLHQALAEALQGLAAKAQRPAALQNYALVDCLLRAKEEEIVAQLAAANPHPSESA